MSRQFKIVKIESAKYLNDYTIKIAFSDGKIQQVDFGPFLEGSSHPEIRKFLDKRKFKEFSVNNGEFIWGDFDLIFPIMTLYENRLVEGSSEGGG